MRAKLSQCWPENRIQILYRLIIIKSSFTFCTHWFEIYLYICSTHICSTARLLIVVNLFLFFIFYFRWRLTIYVFELIGRHSKKRALSDWLMAPNTKWCGRGQSASKYSQLGGASKADKCCRRHDHCRFNIHSMTTKWHMFNYRPFTISHCSCDMRLGLFYYYLFIFCFKLKRKCFSHRKQIRTD